MKQLKKPRVLIWQYEALRLIEILSIGIILCMLIVWSFFSGVGYGVVSYGGAKSRLASRLADLTASQALEDARPGLLWLFGIMAIIVISWLGQKAVLHVMQDSLTQATTLTKLTASSGESIKLPLLKASSPWRCQTLLYTQLRHAPIWKPNFGPKLDRQTREKRQRTWIEQEKRERKQRLYALESNEVMVTPIEIATLFGTLSLSPYEVRQGKATSLNGKRAK